MLRLLAGLFLLTSTYAYQQDLSKVPNGNTYGITLGHPGGATKKATIFANSFYSSGQKWTKAFCQADADGDGQSNGFEMGDPCCIWTVGQKPMITTGLSDPNSASSKTVRMMPNCVQSNHINHMRNMYHMKQQVLQCPVCVQALQLEVGKPSDNAVDFALLSVKSCKGAAQDDQQQALCVKTLIKNADQLFNDQKNGVTPTQSCTNLGLACMKPTTQAPLPTTQAPVPTTQAPTPTSNAPVPIPTTQAPLPTTQAPMPTPPLPPIIVYTPGTSGKVSAPVETAPVETASTNVAMIVMISVISTLATAAMVWGVSRLCNSKNKKEPMLNMLDGVNDNDQSFSALPDVDYNTNT